MLKMTDHAHRYSLLLAIAIASATVSAPGFAQQQVNGQGAASVAPGPANTNIGGLEEIVVTANRREQDASKVGVSIAAVSGDDLEKMELVTATDIVAHIPNVENMAYFGPGVDANFSIRGVSQNDYNNAGESMIAGYVDDVYLIPTGAMAFSLFDMKRVEVLRGPQGTLFGRNSTAGAIQFVSNKPTDDFGASVSGEYGSYSTRKFNGVLNAPLIDQVLDVRLAAHYENNNGWMNNPSGLTRPGGQFLDDGVRLQLLYRPNSDVTDLVKLSWDHASGLTNGEMHAAATGWPSVAANAASGNNILIPLSQNFYGTCGGCDPYGQPTLGFVDNVNVPPTLKDAHSYIVSNVVSMVTGKTTISSITAYNGYFKDMIQDCDGTPLPICQTHYRDPYAQYSQEFRAYIDNGDLRTTFGVYYLHAKVSGVLAYEAFGNEQLVPGHTGLMVMGEDKQTSWGSAVFGNVEKDFADNKWTFIGGVRLAVDSKHINQDAGYYLDCPSDPGFAGFQSGYPIVPYCGNIAFGTFNDKTANGANKFTSWTWSGKLELDYKPNDDTLIYASESHGSKAGAFNNQLPTIGLFPQMGGSNADFYVRPESLFATELGLKQKYLDHRVQLAASVFYYDYVSYQNQAWLNEGSIISNFKAQDYGGELDLSVIPFTGWSVNVNGGVAIADVFNLRNAYGAIGTHPMSIDPHWNAGATVRYETTVFGHGVIGFQGDVHGRAGFYGESSTFNDSYVPGNVRGNLRMDYTAPGGNYVVEAYVNNIANSQDIATVFDLGNNFGLRFANAMPPRWFGVGLTYKLH